jgi:hypothetical protein
MGFDVEGISASRADGYLIPFKRVSWRFFFRSDFMF